MEIFCVLVNNILINISNNYHKKKGFTDHFLIKGDFVFGFFNS